MSTNSTAADNTPGLNVIALRDDAAAPALRHPVMRPAAAAPRAGAWCCRVQATPTCKGTQTSLQPPHKKPLGLLC